MRVIGTLDGILLKPKAAFVATELVDVAGIFQAKVLRRTDAEIQAALALSSLHPVKLRKRPALL